jgi:hypothetical protein
MVKCTKGQMKIDEMASPIRINTYIAPTEKADAPNLSRTWVWEIEDRCLLPTTHRRKAETDHLIEGRIRLRFTFH